MSPLPLEEVRRLAREAGLRESQYNKTSRVVAFHFGEETRFNVYYSTGTVGTYLLHPRQGKTELFRRNVSVELLRKIFRTPRIHTDFGYHHRQDRSDLPRKRARTLSGYREGASTESLGDIDGEENAAKKQLEKLCAEKAALEHEITEVKGILDDHEHRREKKREKKEADRKRQEEEERRQKAIAKKDKKEEMREQRGVCGSWALKESDDFKNNFTDDTRCVAVGSDGAHLCLYDGGGWAYSSELPDNLYKLLHTRAKSHPSPEYVAMGSMHRYFIRFKNGKTEWVGPPALDELLEQDNRRVKSVAFGEDFEDYFVVFEGGGYEYVGCPDGLGNKIEARKSRSDLEKVTLGPNGEWFLWAKNGTSWWGGLGDDLAGEVSSTHKEGYITDCLFGDDGYYFIRYSGE